MRNKSEANLSKEIGFKYLGLLGLLGPTSQDAGFSDNPLIPMPRGSLVEFSWSTDEAVENVYLEEAKIIITQLPSKRRDLAENRYAQSARKEWLNQLDTRVGLYVDQDSPERQSMPSHNPFNLFMPEGLRDIDRWLREQRKEYEYSSASVRAYQRERDNIEHAPKQRVSEQHEDNFIGLVKAWNEYHVKFLKLLNIQDSGERVRSVEAIGREIFGKSLGFLSSPNLEKISPFDNPNLWMVYNSLNVLISDEPRITSTARYRAIELLTHFDTEEMKLTYFGKERRVKSFTKRERPSASWESFFSNNLLRLPRTFWESAKDRSESIHEDWEENSKIRALFGKTLDQRRYDERTFDYGQIFNRLVEQYPYEAIQINLLMLNSYSHCKFALEGLLSMAKLDPIAIQKIFGHHASYLKIHQMPSDSEERVQESLGIRVFDEDFVSDLGGLTPEQILQVTRRYQVRIWDLERELAGVTQERAANFFASKSRRELKRLDPKGYWRLLGVHPETDPDDLQELLRRSIRVLAVKYHPDTGNEPDLEKMKQLNVAYDVLSNPKSRKSYCGL